MGPEQALRWKTRFAAMYALGAWTLLGYCVYYSREPLLEPLPPDNAMPPSLGLNFYMKYFFGTSDGPGPKE